MNEKPIEGLLWKFKRSSIKIKEEREKKNQLMPPIHVSPIMMNKKTQNMIVFCCNKPSHDPPKYDEVTYLLACAIHSPTIFLYMYCLLFYSTR